MGNDGFDVNKLLCCLKNVYKRKSTDPRIRSLMVILLWPKWSYLKRFNFSFTAKTQRHKDQKINLHFFRSYRLSSDILPFDTVSSKIKMIFQISFIYVSEFSFELWVTFAKFYYGLISNRNGYIEKLDSINYFIHCSFFCCHQKKEPKKSHRFIKFAKNLQNHPKIHELVSPSASLKQHEFLNGWFLDFLNANFIRRKMRNSHLILCQTSGKFAP